ncbi:Hypothetical predicted protein, partial [Scomber scombrus]
MLTVSVRGADCVEGADLGAEVDLHHFRVFVFISGSYVAEETAFVSLNNLPSIQKP